MTRYQVLLRQGDLDGGRDAPVYALLRLKGGAWRVLTFVLGPTDVAYADWWSRYGAPKAIFPYTSSGHRAAARDAFRARRRSRVECDENPVFGATGRVGQLVVQRALDSGTR